MLRTQISTLAANEAANAVLAMLDGGRLAIYDGDQPNADEPAGVVPLATLGFGYPAFERAENAEAIARAISPDENASRSGEATWFRAFTADGIGVFDGSVGDDNTANLNLDDVNIQIRARVSVSRLVYTQRMKEHPDSAGV